MHWLCVVALQTVNYIRDCTFLGSESYIVKLVVLMDYILTGM
jgi:hypothetical protein